jgi:transposase InsO family protein
VSPRTPVNRHSDRTALLVKKLHAKAPLLGRRKLAAVLARAGLVLAASTVERLHKREPPKQAPAARAEPADEVAEPNIPKEPRVVHARHPHHLWHVDLTTISTAGGSFLPWWPFACFLLWPFAFHIALVLDHHTRALVAFAVFRREPSAAQLCALLDLDVERARTAPRHIVSDRGRQFESEYRDWCTRNHVRPRFGAIGKHGSIAVIERFIRSLKMEHLKRTLIPFSAEKLARLIESYQRFYNEHRPHEALGGLTPDERHKGVVLPRARFEPRALWPLPPDVLVRRGDDLVLEVEHVDGLRHLPVVSLRPGGRA